MAIFFKFSPTSNHFHPLQVENCDSNSRLVVDEDDDGKFRLERVKENDRLPCLPLILARPIWPAPPGYLSQYLITIGYSLLLTIILLTK